MDLSDIELDILDDMLDEWADRDRHGQLESEHRYDSAKIEAFGALYTRVYLEIKRRRKGGNR
ncbi:hypothetical protein LHJ74_30785 [Streptomyces sp. N2-109]|uniref:Uncharacterized protein n=1 Tax=Streptomyces gossypii TaxID=2883101 RepID=A0ABT2K2X2_9ACTN|nr:hypothetical protein [Streptomyces gossypii]MCT2594243.1 hypothetical protein [Streptomyces gossypii]